MSQVQIRISGGLYASMLVIMGSVMQFMLLPAPLIERTGQEAWAAVLIGGLYSLLVSFAVAWIACRFPARDPLAAMRATLGPWVPAPISLLYAALNLLLVAMAVNDIQSFATIMLLPGTPGLVLSAVVAGLAIYAVLQGLEPIARIAYGFVVPLVLVTLLLPGGLFREFSILQVDPFLWKGYSGLVQATLLTWPWSGQSIIVLSLLRHLSPTVNAYRWTLIGVGGATLLLAVDVALTSLVFGSTLPGRMLYPGFEILAIIAISEAIERIQAAILVLWLSGGMLKVALNLYAAVEEGSLALGIRNRRTITIVLAAAGVAMAQVLIGPLQRTGLTGQPWWTLLHVGTQLVVLLLLAGAALLTRLRQGRSLNG